MTEHSRLLARGGALLFALALLNGFLVHVLPLQRPALGAHVIGLIGSAFLLALSSAWPRLAQSESASRIGIGLALYGFFVGWAINLSGAVTGRFGVFPISMGPAQPTTPADFVVSAILLSVALTLLALAGLLFRGFAKSKAG